MDTLVYEGKTYTRRGQKWADAANMIVHEGLQRDLNKAYAGQLEPAALPLDKCISHGDSFKNSGSYSLALKFYEEAVEKADYQTMSYILPRMTSCYRKNGQPQKAIDLLTYASNTFGSNMVTAALYTSAAAAYCDLGKYSLARKCCSKAYAKGNGAHSEELSLVYKRIEKETKE